MGNKSSNIEINGKRYDAVSGSVLEPVATSDKGSGFSIDGVTRSRGENAVTDLRPPKHTAEPQRASKKAHAPAKHLAAHKQEPSRTLMRSSVKKPDIKAPAHISAKSRTDIAAKVPRHEVAPKLSHFTVDPVRRKRAERIIKSPAVSRFGSVSGIQAIAPYSPALHLVAAPGKASQTPHIPVQAETTPDAAPDIFARALSFDSGKKQVHTKHTATKAKKAASSRRHLALATSVSLLFLLVLGIFAYVNIPAISVRMASARAGFQAKLPSYSPIGFHFGTLSYGPGNVTVSYQDSSMSERQFDIRQRSTGWDNTALLNNFVASANKAYQTYQRAGHTVYLYGDNTATWVQSGIWYTIDGGGSLTRNQVLDLAGSL